MAEDSIADLVRRIRRSALDARTLSVTLESSLATLHEIPSMSGDERMDARRRWIGEVRADLDRVERLSRKHHRLAEDIAARCGPLPVEAKARLDAELADADARIHAARAHLQRAANHG